MSFAVSKTSKLFSPRPETYAVSPLSDSTSLIGEHPPKLVEMTASLGLILARSTSMTNIAPCRWGVAAGSHSFTQVAGHLSDGGMVIVVV